MGLIHQGFSDFQHEHRYFLWFYENMKTLQIISFLLKPVFPPQYEKNPEHSTPFDREFDGLSNDAK